MFDKLPTEVTQRHCNILLFGAPGVGKSIFAASHPGTVYVLDNERGLAMYAPWCDHVYTASPKDWQDTDKHLKEVAAMQQDASQSYAIVWDSVTAFWDALQYTRAEYEKNGSKQVGNLNLGDWGVIKKIQKNLATRIQALPMNVIVIAHERAISNADGYVSGFVPDCEKNVPYVFDIIARMTATSDGKRYLNIQKRRGETPPWDELDITGKTFTDVFGKLLNLKVSDTDKYRNLAIRMMYARTKKDMKVVLDEAETTLKAEHLKALKEAAKEKLGRL